MKGTLVDDVTVRYLYSGCLSLKTAMEENVQIYLSTRFIEKQAANSTALS